MQTWAKRGLQTALVTGGLLMLGTGIASADEDVNPDRPASPLDGSFTVPVHLDNNTIGTPLGQKAVPTIHRDIRIGTADVTGTLPVAKATSVTGPVAAKATKAATPVAAKVQGAVESLPQQARDQAAPLAAKAKPVTDSVVKLPGAEKLGNTPTLTDKVNVPATRAIGGDAAQGNRVNADLVVPVDISGNAIAVLGKAHTTNESDHAYGTNRDVATSGAGSFISGNVVDLDWALPVQVTNNAVAGLGTASAEGTNAQEAWATGDIVSDGAHSFLGGNVVAPQFATPVQVDGNAVAGGGNAAAFSEAQTSAESGGTILTSGEDSAAGGNAVPVPVAVPARVNGNAVMGLGKAIAETYSTADATAGATRLGKYAVPTYVETNGDPALAAGNIVQPAVSGPAMLCGNAGGAAGAAYAACDTATDTAAGGTSRTTGEGSVLSGAIAAAPVALPVQGFGNAGTVLGKASTDATNSVDSTAGGSSYTRGHDSVLSGTAASPSVAGPLDLFANSVAAGGTASSVAHNAAITEADGHTGTTGDNSVIGGNAAGVPIVLPGEAFGNAVGAAGGADAMGTETKGTTSGSGKSTDDDNGLLASNLASVPVVSAVQLFGNGVGALAFTDAVANTDTTLSAGGDNRATGKAGILSGNVGHAPVALPVQAFGNGASGLAKGYQTAINTTEMESGGDTQSDGSHAAGSGNVVAVPVAGAGQLFGESVAALGRNHALAGAITETEAGGDTETNGEHGLISGNVVSPQALPLAQSFGVVASGLGGLNSSASSNTTESESGGDIDTSGEEGFLSGNLLDVPAAAAVQPFGDAVAALGSKSYAQGISETEGEVGGTSTTTGRLGSLSGLDGTVPVGASLPIYDVPVEVLARAIAESANRSVLQVGEGENQLALPVAGGMSATDLPSLQPRPSSRALPTDGFGGSFTGVLSGFGKGMNGVPAVPAQGQVADVAGVVTNGGLGEAPQILPAPLDRSGRSGRTGIVDPVSNLVDGVSVNGTHVPVEDVFGGIPAAFPPGMPTEVPEGLPVRLPDGGRAAADDPLSGLLGGLPVGDLLGSTPVGDGLPVDGLPLGNGGLPVNGLPVGNGGLPVNGLPLGNGGLPVNALPVNGLPVANGGLPVQGLPVGGGRADAGNPFAGLLGGLSIGDGGLPVGDLPVGRAAAGDPFAGLLGGLPVGNGGLPVNGAVGGDLPVGDLPVGGRAAADDPLSGLLGGLPVGDLLGSTPVGDGLPVDGLPLGNGGLPVNALPVNGLPIANGGLPVQGLPIGGGRADAGNPLAGLLGGLPVGNGGLPVGNGAVGGDLPIGGDLPVAGLLGATPLGGGGLPVNGLPVQGLPVQGLPLGNGGLPVQGLPIGRDLPAVPGLPVGDGILPPLPNVPIGPFGGPLGRSDIPEDPSEITMLIPVIPAVDDMAGMNEMTMLIPAVPAKGSMTDVTAIIPVIPAANDMTDVTAVLPVIPAAPGAGEITSIPLVQSPSFGTLPVPMPDVAGVQAPGVADVNGSSLDSTRAALANLFATHPVG